MKLSLVFDPMLEVPPVVSTVNDLDAAIEAMQDHEEWIHATSDPDGRCDTILMANDYMTVFHLYVELTNLRSGVAKPQVDTFFLDND